VRFERIDIEVLKGALVNLGVVDAGDSVFNPSFVEEAPGSIIFAVRKVSGGKPGLRSQLILRVNVLNWPQVSVELLSEVTELGGYRVRDLKLLKRDDDGKIFVTFNTGHERQGNEILLADLEDLDSPFKIELGGRRRIEKNWGFFWDSGRLFALYRVSPLVMLEQDIDQSFPGQVRMKLSSGKVKRLGLHKLVSIGSQPVRYKGGLLIACHLKPTLLWARAYIPFLIFINLESQKVLPISISIPWRDLSFTWSRWNRKAWAVNYVSGLLVLGDKIILGIGRADDDYEVFSGFMAQ
jgi:hypothetical protein